LSIVKPCFSMVSAIEVRGAHPVDDDLDPAEVNDQVAVEGALVEVELVDQAGATAGLHTHAKAKVVTTLLLEQARDLGCSNVRQQYAMGRLAYCRFFGNCVREAGLGVVLNTHVLNPSSGWSSI